eukprot:scaffold2614_cov57-Cylindrotheca_fusiformis.AAC.2
MVLWHIVSRTADDPFAHRLHCSRSYAGFCHQSSIRPAYIVLVDGLVWYLIACSVCYGLYTGAGGSLETLVELTVDLRGDFNGPGISVAPEDKLQRTANIEYGLVAFQCTGKLRMVLASPKKIPAGTFNQRHHYSLCRSR